MMPTTVYQCPIDTCGWEHTEPPAPDDITQWPGYGTVPLMDLPKHMTRHRVMEVDAALREHLDTHTPVEFVTEITRLTQQITSCRLVMEPWQWEAANHTETS